MKKNKKTKEFLEHLKNIPIILVACEKSGLSRNTVYRWRRDDEEFRKEMEEALRDGEELINDMSESQLLTLIKEKNWHAISFWLRHRNPRFKDKVEVTAKIENNEALTPEQEEVVREALRLALPQAEVDNNLNLENNESITINPTNIGGVNGVNVEGQESKNGNN